MEEEGKGGTYSKTTKSAPTEGAGMPSKGKGTRRRKEIKESREKKSSTHDQATRNIVRIEKELSRRTKEEN